MARGASRGEKDYRLGIRAAVRGAWNGALDAIEFTGAMIPTIRRGLERAWQDGAKEAGISPEERTPAEQRQLDEIINGEFARILPFFREIEAESKANGKLLRPQLQRSEMWILRYRGVQNKAKLEAKNDPKLEWVWDPLKEHCVSCERLNGQVRRASFWRVRGIIPQNPPNPLLECGGWKCGCKFIVTEKPLSRGRLPNLP